MEESHRAVGLVVAEPQQALQGQEAACHRKAEEAMTPVQLPEVPALPRAMLSSPFYQLPPEWNAIIESDLTARLAPSETNSD